MIIVSAGAGDQSSAVCYVVDILKVRSQRLNTIIGSSWPPPCIPSVNEGENVLKGSERRRSYLARWVQRCPCASTNRQWPSTFLSPCLHTCFLCLVLRRHVRADAVSETSFRRFRASMAVSEALLHEGPFLSLVKRCTEARTLKTSVASV